MEDNDNNNSTDHHDDDDDEDIPISKFQFSFTFSLILYALEYKWRLDIVYVLHMSHSRYTSHAEIIAFIPISTYCDEGEMKKKKSVERKYNKK